MFLGLPIVVLFVVGVEGDADSSVGAPSRRLAGLVPFSFPTKCSDRVNSPFCATGDYFTIGERVKLDMNIYLFDAFKPDNTLLFGLNAVFDRGVPQGLNVRTGGCAAPTFLGLSGDAVLLATTICTSGGGPGEYDPSTGGYSAGFEMSGDTGIYFDRRRSVLPVVPFKARGYAYASPNFDVGLNATILDSGGDPRVFQISLNFVNTINSVNSSIFTCRVFSGLNFDVYGTRIGRKTYSATFIDQIVDIQPFS